MPPVVSTNPQYFTDELAASPAYDAAVPEREWWSDVDLLQELYSTGLLVGLLVDAELAKIAVPDRLFSFIGWVTRLEPVTPSTLAAETGLPPTTIRDYVRRARRERRRAQGSEPRGRPLVPPRPHREGTSRRGAGLARGRRLLRPRRTPPRAAGRRPSGGDARAQRGGTAGARRDRRATPAAWRSGLQIDEVAGLDLALELRHGVLSRLQRGGERRRAAGVQLLLEATSRSADLVEPRRRRQLRRLSEHVP